MPFAFGPLIVGTATVGVGNLYRCKHPAAVQYLVDGATVGIDVRSDTVSLRVPQSQSGPKVQNLLKRARSFGEAVTITRIPAKAHTVALYDGEALDYGYCSMGFAVYHSGHEDVVTAGHCTDAREYWSVAEGYYGYTVASTFSRSGDYGLIHRSQPIRTIGQLPYPNGWDITYAGYIDYNTYVCKQGATSGYTCGRAKYYGVAVDYVNGPVVDGLLSTTVCVQGGDSGGALHYYHMGVGVASGSADSCSGGRSYFEDLPEIRDAYGLDIE